MINLFQKHVLRISLIVIVFIAVIIFTVHKKINKQINNIDSAELKKSEKDTTIDDQSSIRPARIRLEKQELNIEKPHQEKATMVQPSAPKNTPPPEIIYESPITERYLVQ